MNFTRRHIATLALGRQLIVDNKAGAGGNIGTAAAAKARNDGYSLMLTVNRAHPTSPVALMKGDLPRWAKIVKDSGATVD